LKEFQADLVFPDNTDETLIKMVSAINTYRRPSNSIDDESKFVSFINLVIVPDEYKAQYYMVCLDAFDINLTSYTPFELPNVLRFTFMPADVLLIEDSAPEELMDSVTSEEVDEIFLEHTVKEEFEESVYVIEEDEEEEIIEEDDDFY
jgi:hypothetical protein